jgi:hypothetical protein
MAKPVLVESQGPHLEKLSLHLLTLMTQGISMLLTQAILTTAGDRQHVAAVAEWQTIVNEAVRRVAAAINQNTPPAAGPGPPPPAPPPQGKADGGKRPRRKKGGE